MFNPKKRVPAAVEFSDLGGVTGPTGGAQALVDIAAYKNADALVHVLRAFSDPAVARASIGLDDPARDAQPWKTVDPYGPFGITERRLERLERDLKKGGHGARARA